MLDHGAVTQNFAARTRTRLRDEVLAAATEQVLTHGWRGLRMQAVADAVGVSRQTINNEFTDKQGLARALVLTIAAAYADECELVIEQSTSLESAFRDAVHRGLELASTDQVFRAVMTPDGSDTFLPLYTSDSAPLVSLVSTRMSAALARRWPSLDPQRLRITVEATTRHVLSHIVLPLYPADRVADEAAALFTPYLTGDRPGPTCSAATAPEHPVSTWT
jgi:AcrR family transcriptional regulator